jgi:protease I
VAAQLQGKRVAFLVANEGVEQVELTEPLEAVRKAGAEADLIAPDGGKILGFNHLDKGDTFTADKGLDEVSADDYDALVLPGGVANPDFLRTDERAVSFVRSFFEQGKPVGAICHGPWTLVEADVVRGRTLTSWPSLQTDPATLAGTGSTRRFTPTAGSSPAASPTTCRHSTRRSWRSSRRASTRASGLKRWGRVRLD